MGTERRAGQGGHSGLLQQADLELLGRAARAADVGE